MEESQLTAEEIAQFNEYAGLFEFQSTWIYRTMLTRPESILCLYKGNQGGGTSMVAHQYILRMLNMHPVAHKNIRPDDKIRTIRCASEVLPNDPEGGEVQNTQYPALKRYIPPSWIVKDITIRKPVMIVRPPGNRDVIIEFVSYGQTTQKQAGVQRASVWLDEHAPFEFYQEQKRRILAANGDIIISITPALGQNWEYEELFEKAKIYVRTDAVRHRLYRRHNQKTPRVQKTESLEDIAVVQWATDDNPFYQGLVDKINKEQGKQLTVKTYLDSKFSGDDPEELDVRRYGIFRQLSGTIFKDFEYSIHVISKGKLFDHEIPHEWLHVRGIDFHEQNPWAIGWVALSQHNEMFVYNEWNPSPDKWVTLEIARKVAAASGDYKFNVNLIDPLAAKNQMNTGQSSLDDLNRYFHELKRQGIGTGGYWQTWDTKSTKGRDALKERLKNSRLVKRPYNNRVVKDGFEQYLPTIWFTDNCTNFILSMKNWRWEEPVSKDWYITKDEKDKPQQRYSHFPMVLEGILKFPGFAVAKFRDSVVPQRNRARYFNARA